MQGDSLRSVYGDEAKRAARADGYAGWASVDSWMSKEADDER